MTKAVLLVVCIAAFGCCLEADVVCTVRNSASRASGVPRGGALATLECTGLEGKPGLLQAPEGGPAPFKLGDIEVLVNGAPSPILSVFFPSEEEAAAGVRQRVVFQVPLERNASPLDSVYPSLRQAGVKALLLLAGNGIRAPRPGAFFRDSDGYLIAEHTSDGSRVTKENPAHPGETITVYANDFFSVWPPPPVGVPVPETTRYEYSAELSAAYTAPELGYDRGHLFLEEQPVLNSRVCAKTPALKVLFKGLAPGRIGMERIDFVVPLRQAPGEWPLFFNMGSPTDGSGEGCADAEASSSESGLLIVK